MMQVEPSTSVPYMVHNEVNVLIADPFPTFTTGTNEVNRYRAELGFISGWAFQPWACKAAPTLSALPILAKSCKDLGKLQPILRFGKIGFEIR